MGDSDISALRSVFEWGVRNAKLQANPAKDIRVTRTKPVQTRSKSLMAEEAKAILSHALHHRRAESTPRHSQQALGPLALRLHWGKGW